jgi:flagellar basal body rod protein FlgG
MFAISTMQNRDLAIDSEQYDDVYDVVDESEYSKRVQSRIDDDDFIVDDDGDYDG